MWLTNKLFFTLTLIQTNCTSESSATDFILSNVGYKRAK